MARFPAAGALGLGTVLNAESSLRSWARISSILSFVPLPEAGPLSRGIMYAFLKGMKADLGRLFPHFRIRNPWSRRLSTESRHEVFGLECRKGSDSTIPVLTQVLLRWWKCQKNKTGR